MKPSKWKLFERWAIRNWDILFAVVWYIIWLWTGVLFSTLYWGFGVVQGLTFSFFAMSTAGLQAPGDTRTVGLLFTTLYVVIGVPSFAVLCGYIIGFFQDKYTQMKERSQQVSCKKS